MFGTAIIVFREVLEAALIIGIVSAATRDVPKRNLWIVGGLLLGLIGAGVVAAFTDVIASYASGVGQEILNATVLGIAVLMLAWHNIWMTSHGAELASHARNVGKNIRDGVSECSILLIVIGLAVLREGSETALFLYGLAASGEQNSSGMLMGGAIGVLAGIALGYIVYAGLLRIPMRWFFAATGGLILLLAAGMASQAAKFLVQADVLPSLGNGLWDSSNIVSEQSPLGMILHSLVGYDAHPAGMQVVFYLVVLVGITMGMRYVNTKN
jgi:high-affinity iron transporter